MKTLDQRAPPSAQLVAQLKVWEAEDANCRDAIRSLRGRLIGLDLGLRIPRLTVLYPP